MGGKRGLRRREETHLKVERKAVRGEVGVVHFVLEAKTLADEELEVKDVLGLRFDLCREGVDGDGVVLRLGREEDASEPVTLKSAGVLPRNDTERSKRRT